MPNARHSLASVVAKRSPTLAAHLFAAAIAQNLFLDSPDDARRVAGALASIRDAPFVHPWAYEGQKPVMGVVPPGSNVRATSGNAAARCTVRANRVFECAFENQLRHRQRILIDAGAKPTEVEVLARIRANTLLEPRHGDRFVEGFPPKGTTKVEITVSPPACAPGDSVSRDTAFLAPHERFFSLPLRSRLNAGDSVTIEEGSAGPRRLTVADPGDSAFRRARVYTRFGNELLANGSLSRTGALQPRFAASFAVSPDFALITPRVPHPSCVPKLRDYISLHAFADFRYESVTTTARLPGDLSTLRGSTRSGPLFESGLYMPLPIPRTQWRKGGRAYSTIFGPMLKTGVHGRTGESDVFDERRPVRRGPYPFLAAGARIAMFRYTNFVKGTPGSVEKLFFQADFLRGRWTNFSVPTVEGDRVPWRWETRVNLSVPHTPFFAGGFFNFGGPGPDDYRLFFGYRIEISKGSLWPKPR